MGHMTHDLGLTAPCSRDQGPSFSDPKALFHHGQGKERTINTCRRLLILRFGHMWFVIKSHHMGIKYPGLVLKDGLIWINY